MTTAAAIPLKLVARPVGRERGPGGAPVLYVLQRLQRCDLDCLARCCPRASGRRALRDLSFSPLLPLASAIDGGDVADPPSLIAMVTVVWRGSKRPSELGTAQVKVPRTRNEGKCTAHKIYSIQFIRDIRDIDTLRYPRAYLRTTVCCVAQLEVLL